MKFKADEVRAEVYRRAMREAEDLRKACAVRKAERAAERANARRK